VRGFWCINPRRANPRRVVARSIVRNVSYRSVLFVSIPLLENLSVSLSLLDELILVPY